MYELVISTQRAGQNSPQDSIMEIHFMDQNEALLSAAAQVLWMHDRSIFVDAYVYQGGKQIAKINKKGEIQLVLC